MKNKNYSFFLLVFSLSFVLTGCFGEEVGTTEGSSVVESTRSDFSLTAIKTEVPDLPDARDVFVETVTVPVPEKKAERVKTYEDFSSEIYAKLKGSAPFVLFFTQEECTRCDQLHNFLSRNLGVLPNYTQVLRVTWDEYPNLQTELLVRRPATLVFFSADGQVADTLFAPPIDRIEKFFIENQPK